MIQYSYSSILCRAFYRGVHSQSVCRPRSSIPVLVFFFAFSRFLPPVIPVYQVYSTLFQNTRTVFILTSSKNDNCCPGTEWVSRIRTMYVHVLLYTVSHLGDKITHPPRTIIKPGFLDNRKGVLNTTSDYVQT